MAKTRFQKRAAKLEAAIQLAHAPMDDNKTLAQLRLERMELALELKATTVIIEEQLALLQDELGVEFECECECECGHCSTFGDT
jgi:hypothetical protein